MIAQKQAFFWCAILLVLALSRVHFRVVTTNVAYHLGRLKATESSLLEKRATLQTEWAKLTGKKQLQTLSDEPAPTSHEKGGAP